MTAEQAFEEADVDGDGQLSFDEFKAWYADNQGTAGEVAQVTEQAESWMSLAEVRKLTSLQEYSVEDVFEVFAEQADEEGALSKQSFFECFAHIAEESGNEIDVDRFRIVVDRLFATFDTDGNGSVDFSELASGLSVLCGGSRDEKVEAAFALYDFNGDGFISLDEMTRYLTSVFKVLYETQPGTREQMGVEPEELAAVTAEQAFEEADANGDGQLSFDEFKAWYADNQAGGDDDEEEDQSSESESDDEDDDDDSESDDDDDDDDDSDSDDDDSWMSLQCVRRLTGLQDSTVDVVFEAFADCADDDGLIDASSFRGCFESFMRGSPHCCSVAFGPPQRQRAEQVVQRLFTLFDTDGVGSVDFRELACGTSVLCGGERDAKVAAAFALYDLNEDGFISREEMTLYLTSVFKVLYEIQPGTGQRIGVGVDELAETTTLQCFEDADVDSDGRLSYDEFQEWYSKGGPMPDDDDSEDDSEEVSEDDSKDDEDSDEDDSDDSDEDSETSDGSGEDGDGAAVTMASMRALTKLDCFEVDEVFEILAERAPEGVRACAACV